MTKIPALILTLVFALMIFDSAVLEAQVVQDYLSVLEIPDVVDAEASATHLYVLSETEGMAVFRSYPDSLQWLYTSTGMQRRGNTIRADVRFAYLFGNSRRLTVLEPTSVLGVYSSTILPSEPVSAGRINNTLFVSMKDLRAGMLSLESPESVDSAIELLNDPQLENKGVLDLTTSELSKRLYILTDSNELLIYTYLDDQISFERKLTLGQDLRNLIRAGEDLYGSTSNGRLFRITSAGLSPGLGNLGEMTESVHSWDGYLFVRTAGGKVWLRDQQGNFSEWKSDSRSGNLLASNDKELWVSENGNLTSVKKGMAADTMNTMTITEGPFSITPIPNQILTFPSPLLLALEAKGAAPGDVEFALRSEAGNAQIRGNGLLWQPTVNQLGLQWFTVVAATNTGESDSTRFSVDVRSFNAPPRFGPIRDATIAVGEEYKLQVTAVDPEDPQSKLIRYLGVDLPEGAVINEKTGTFVWNPAERQTGKITFRVIATDKLGAANSVDITLTVKDITRGDS